MSSVWTWRIEWTTSLLSQVFFRSQWQAMFHVLSAEKSRQLSWLPTSIAEHMTTKPMSVLYNRRSTQNHIDIMPHTFCHCLSKATLTQIGDCMAVHLDLMNAPKADALGWCRVRTYPPLKQHQSYRVPTYFTPHTTGRRLLSSVSADCTNTPLQAVPKGRKG